MKNLLFAFGLIAGIAIALSSFTISLTRSTGQPGDTTSRQMIPPHLITIVDMIPGDRSDETRHDSEPNIAVHPGNPNIIAASAFTFTSRRDLCDTSPCVGSLFPSCKAPIYLSFDGGLTWRLEDVLVSNNGITHDITLAFGPSGHLYASFLEGCFAADNVMKGFMTMRSTAPVTLEGASRLLEMDTVDTRYWRRSPDINILRNIFDQPWIVTTTNGRSDKVFIGVNRVGEAMSNGGNGRTARVITSQSGRETTFSGVPVEKGNIFEKNLSAIRVAAHPDSNVYAIFYRWVPGGIPAGSLHPASLHPTCDIVVVRDDNFGRMNFNQLLNGGTGTNVGKIVARGVVPTSNPLASDPARRLIPGSSLGGARLVGSNLSIAVNPRNENHVVIAWCALDGEVYTLHTSESRDAGRNWAPLFPDVQNAMNPALAISNEGMIGFLYQRLTSGGRSQWWETHFSTGTDRVSLQDYLLNRFPNDSLPVLDQNSVALRPSLGDYIDLEAVGNTFYGVFSAFNMPDRGTYSSTTRYQRSIMGTTLQLDLPQADV